MVGIRAVWPVPEIFEFFPTRHESSVSGARFVRLCPSEILQEAGEGPLPAIWTHENRQTEGCTVQLRERATRT